AQVPFQTWLPDAMEAPTPVSALIHAATMVNAGVYLLARFYPAFEAVPGWTTAVMTVGLLSALLAALMAVVTYDIKRVLAYSTISQLG
ncbi:MAG: NADH-quinone oxidoreductase subunit L, partial [Chloroflexota bacterium]